MELTLLTVVFHEFLQVRVYQFNGFALYKHSEPIFLGLVIGLAQIRDDYKLVEVAVVVCKFEDLFYVQLLL